MLIGCSFPSLSFLPFPSFAPPRSGPYNSAKLPAGENDICSHQTRSLGSKYTKNAFAAEWLVSANVVLFLLKRNLKIEENVVVSECTMWGKKLHRFIFPIALSELHLLWQFLAYIYLNKFPIIHVFHIIHMVKDGKQLTFYKKLRYREEHSASVVLSWCTLYDISPEKICWWLINHFYVIGHESRRIRRNNANYTAITPFKVI